MDKGIYAKRRLCNRVCFAIIIQRLRPMKTFLKIKANGCQNKVSILTTRYPAAFYEMYRLFEPMHPCAHKLQPQPKPNRKTKPVPKSKKQPERGVLYVLLLLQEITDFRRVVMQRNEAEVQVCDMVRYRVDLDKNSSFRPSTVNIIFEIE